MNNKNILIGAGVVIVGYLLWKKSQKNSQNALNETQYSKECYDSLKSRLMQEDVKPPNFEKTFLENCQKTEIKNKSLPSVSNSTLESKRKEAQSNLDMLLKITDDFNKNSKQEKRNGILYQVDNNGKDIGFWTDNNNFTRTDGKDKLIEQYKKNIKDLGFTFLSTKVLTPAEYEIEKSKMF
jgi:hypothetical protein